MFCSTAADVGSATNAWSGHSPDTSDELRIESTLYTQIHRITQGTQKYTCFHPSGGSVSRDKHQ